MSKIALLRHLITHSVIGVGLFQGMEFIAQRSFLETVRFFFALLSRLWCTLIATLKIDAFEFLLTRDSETNLEYLAKYTQGNE